MRQAACIPLDFVAEAVPEGRMEDGKMENSGFERIVKMLEIAHTEDAVFPPILSINFLTIF